MDRFYYIISQLPMLFFEKESFMTIDIFLMEAKKWLSNRDYRVLSRILIDDTSVEKKDSHLWQEYKKFELRFRTDLALWRQSVHEGREIKMTGFPVSNVKDGNPLEVEKRLLAHRWHFLEEMEKEHHFDFGFLIIYFLKLQILQRLSLFNKEKGVEVFKDIIATKSFEPLEEIWKDDLEGRNQKVSEAAPKPS